MSTSIQTDLIKHTSEPYENHGVPRPNTKPHHTLLPHHTVPYHITHHHHIPRNWPVEVPKSRAGRRQPAITDTPDPQVTQFHGQVKSKATETMLTKKQENWTVWSLFWGNPGEETKYKLHPSPGNSIALVWKRARCKKVWARRGPAKRPGAKTGLRGEKLKSGRKDKTIGWRDSKTCKKWEEQTRCFNSRLGTSTVWGESSRNGARDLAQDLGGGRRAFEIQTILKWLHIFILKLLDFGFLVKAGCCSRACPPLIVTVDRCSGKKVTTGAYPFPLTHPIPPPTLPSDSCMSTPSSVSSHKLNACKKVSWSTARL